MRRTLYLVAILMLVGCGAAPTALPPTTTPNPVNIAATQTATVACCRDIGLLPPAWALSAATQTRAIEQTQVAAALAPTVTPIPNPVTREATRLGANAPTPGSPTPTVARPSPIGDGAPTTPTRLPASPGPPLMTPPSAFARYTADDVVKALAPLGITDVKPLTRDPSSIAPNTASDGREFAIPSIAPKGGQLLIFATSSDLAAMQAWFARFPDLAPYVYTKGNALVQLNNTLPKSEAEKFKAAIEALP